MAGQTRPLARRAVALAPSHGRARCPRPPARRRGGPGAAAPRQGRGSMGPRRTAAPPARAAAPPAPRRSGGVDSNAVAATTSSELEMAWGIKSSCFQLREDADIFGMLHDGQAAFCYPADERKFAADASSYDQIYVMLFLAPSYMIHRLRKLDIMVYLWLKFIAASNTDTFSNPTISGTSDPLYTNKMHD
ncbi:unnamed protein product [Miscanthus lutarioriparius]|uniref:Uncharacterized protein n=1 Tax=Miscanthus lutarioriparius TaxID=422564 RepID=A0A811PT83_9POAL|nr:unnamed protein product [Miscanthus lutarioriparius]